MNSVRVISILILTTSVLSYGQRQTNLKTFNLVGKVTSFKESKYAAREKFGEVTKGEMKDEQSYKFNEKGQLIEKQFNDRNWGSKVIRTYKYDEENKLIEANDSQSRILYKSDPQGNIIEEAVYNRDGDLQSKTYYKYDASNREIEARTNQSGAETKTIYKYDLKGNRTQEILFMGTSQLGAVTTKYDPKGLPIEDIIDSRVKVKQVYKYAFDERGNYITKTVFTASSFSDINYELSASEIWVRKISYELTPQEKEAEQLALKAEEEKKIQEESRLKLERERIENKWKQEKIERDKKSQIEISDYGKIQKKVKEVFGQWASKSDYETEEDYKLRISSKSSERLRSITKDKVDESRQKYLKTQSARLGTYNSETESFPVYFGQDTVAVKIQKSLASAFYDVFSKPKAGNSRQDVFIVPIDAQMINNYWKIKKAVLLFDNAWSSSSGLINMTGFRFFEDKGIYFYQVSNYGETVKNSLVDISKVTTLQDKVYHYEVNYPSVGLQEIIFSLDDLEIALPK